MNATTISTVTTLACATALLVLSGVVLVRADEGDTLVVGTFTFRDIETRRATFAFPNDSRTWERILMRYTLKCDEATVGDPYPCGEWDVSTHVTAHVHTGIMDSTLLTHPYFIVEGESPEELRYNLEPTHHRFSYWEDPDGPRLGDHFMRFDTDQLDSQMPGQVVGAAGIPP